MTGRRKACTAIACNALRASSFPRDTQQRDARQLWGIPDFLPGVGFLLVSLRLTLGAARDASGVSASGVISTAATNKTQRCDQGTSPRVLGDNWHESSHYAIHHRPH
jgi:hypothetical protein